MDSETVKYQIAKLSEELNRMADHYSETLDDAKRMPPTFAPLRTLDLLDAMNEAVIDLGNITEIAIEILDGDHDEEYSKAVLRGAQELGRKQAKRIWELTGLVLQQVQLSHSEKATEVA